jgi:hypothetical protein
MSDIDIIKQYVKKLDSRAEVVKIKYLGNKTYEVIAKEGGPGHSIYGVIRLKIIKHGRVRKLYEKWCCA